MEVLYWFESIRNMEGTALLTKFFEFITFFGHELIPVALICILYWCADKKLAYKIGFSFFLSGLLVQCLKVTFRVPRPFDKFENFNPEESAVDEATSYSFPSGHTQAATSIYGSLALTFKKYWLKIVFVLLFVIVGISRLYLGVHTPLDVGVSMALTFVITALIFSFADKLFDTKKADIRVSLVMLAISLFTIIYSVILCKVTNVIDYEAASDCVKSGGAGIAFAIGYFIERRYIDFDTKAVWWAQIIKVVCGLGIALGLKLGLKALLGENLMADGISYFILVSVILVLYPLLFKLVQKELNKR